MRASLASCSLSLALLLVACMGEQSTTIHAGGPGALDDAAGTHAQAQTCVGTPPVPTQTLRRLNRAELSATLEAVLGDATGIVDGLPMDDSGHFDNDADALSVSPILVEKLDGLLTPLVTRALQDPAAGGTGVRARYLTCNPAGSAEQSCARTVLTTFARTAWRRPPTPDEVSSLLTLFQAGRSAGEGFEASLALAMRGTLLSPHFLFRVEEDPSAGAARVDGHALAVRLSYFLWSAPPDAELTLAAEEGRLSTDAQVEEQVRRMIRAPQAQALVEHFGTQWLELRQLASAQPSSAHYPGFDEALRQSMLEETKRFFGSFVTSERSVLDLVDADHTFADERLAAHYGLSGVSGGTFREVKLPTGRVGLLTQGSVLIGGATPTRGSPTQRGAFILDRLLCRAPPPPPPNVAVSVDAADPSLPMRERLAIHAQSPACAGCHAEMDPIGLTYEHFDGVGAYRETHEGKAIDTAGVLPNGTRFSDPRELAQVLKADPAFSACLAEQLYTYALGRAAKTEDHCALEGVVARFAEKGHRFEELAVAIALSEPFRSRRAQSR